MTRKAAAGSRRSAAGATPSDARPEPTAETPESQTASSSYQLFSDRAEGKSILFAWMQLTREEKLDVLDIDPEQLFSLVTERDLTPEGRAELTRLFASLLGNAEIMNALRLEFVHAVNEEGVVDVAGHPMILILFQALEANLLEAYLQRRIQSRAFYMISLCIWLLFDDIYAIVRIAMIIGLIYVIFKPSDKLLPVSAFLGQVFSDASLSRVETRIESIFVAVLAFSYGYWLRYFYFVMVFLTLLPLLLCEIEARVASGVDKNSLPFARNACSCVCIALLVYLVSGTSWFSTVAVFATFLPRASKTILDWGSLALMIVLGGFVVIRPKQWLLENHLKPWWLAHIGCVLWAVYCVHDFFSTSSWWFHLLLVSLGLFFLVPDTWLAIATVGMSLLKKSIAVIGDPYLVGPTVLGMVLFGYAIVYEIVARLCCRRRAAADESTPADEASSASQSS